MNRRKAKVRVPEVKDCARPCCAETTTRMPVQAAEAVEQNRKDCDRRCSAATMIRPSEAAFRIAVNRWTMIPKKNIMPNQRKVGCARHFWAERQMMIMSLGEATSLVRASRQESGAACTRR